MLYFFAAVESHLVFKIGYMYYQKSFFALSYVPYEKSLKFDALFKHAVHNE